MASLGFVCGFQPALAELGLIAGRAFSLIQWAIEGISAALILSLRLMVFAFQFVGRKHELLKSVTETDELSQCMPEKNCLLSLFHLRGGREEGLFYFDTDQPFDDLGQKQRFLVKVVAQ